MNPAELDSAPGRDEIITEVRAIREALAAEFAFDLSQLFEAAKRWESESEGPKLPPSPKRLSPAKSA